MPLQEVHTGFTFNFDGSKLAAIERGVKRGATNLNTIAAKTQVFSERMGGFFQRARQVVGTYLGFRAVKSITLDYANAADAVAKFASGLGVSAQEYQRVAHAADLSGISTQELNMALPKLAKSAGDAADGSKAMALAFSRAGVDLRDSSGQLKDPITLLTDMADGMKGIEDQGRRTQILMNIFGRNGKKMGVLLDQGSEGIKRMMAEADKLGIVMSQRQLKAAERFKDEMTRVKSVLLGVRNIIAARLLPTITKNLEAFRKWWTEGRNAERALRALKIVAIFTGIAISGVIGAKVISNVQKFVQGIWAGVQALRAMGLAGAFAAIKIWLIIAAFALVALAIEDLIGFAQGKDSVIGRILGDTQLAKGLKKSLLQLGVAVKKAWENLTTAVLKAWTDLRPAVLELWAVIKPLIGPAFGAWIKFVTFAMQFWAVVIRLVAGHLRALIALVSAFGSAVSTAVGEARVAWAIFVSTVKDGLSSLGKLAKVIAKAMGIDLSAAATGVRKAWEFGLKGIRAGLDLLNAGLSRALKLKGLLFGVDIGTLNLEKRTKQIRESLDVAEAPAGGAVLPGLFQPRGVERFAGGVPLPAVSAPITGGVIGPPVVNTSVAAGAVQLNFTGAAANDPEAVARVVRPIVSKVITDASRDIAKPPRGQT